MLLSITHPKSVSNSVKLASSCHIARFITGRDQTKYIYRKLRFIWRAGLLESFKVLSGDTYSLYYMLSKRGLAILLENGLWK
jgi:hypothetical protein